MTERQEHQKQNEDIAEIRRLLAETSVDVKWIKQTQEKHIGMFASHIKEDAVNFDAINISLNKINAKFAFYSGALVVIGFVGKSIWDWWSSHK